MHSPRLVLYHHITLFIPPSQGLFIFRRSLAAYLTLQGKGCALGLGFPAFRAELVQAGDRPPIPRPSALRTPRRSFPRYRGPMVAASKKERESHDERQVKTRAGDHSKSSRPRCRGFLEILTGISVSSAAHRYGWGWSSLTKLRISSGHLNNRCGGQIMRHWRLN